MDRDCPFSPVYCQILSYKYNYIVIVCHILTYTYCHENGHSRSLSHQQNLVVMNAKFFRLFMNTT